MPGVFGEMIMADVEVEHMAIRRRLGVSVKALVSTTISFQPIPCGSGSLRVIGCGTRHQGGVIRSDGVVIDEFSTSFALIEECTGSHRGDCQIDRLGAPESRPDFD